MIKDICYPFHVACWSLLEDSQGGNLLEDELQVLFDVFESFHYSKKARALTWGKKYYFGSILDSYPGQGEDAFGRWQEDLIATNKGNTAILSDPTSFKTHADATQNCRPISSELLSSDPSPRIRTGIPVGLIAHNAVDFPSLPAETFQFIVCNLSCEDAQNLLRASPSLYRMYCGGENLPDVFWESRFWARGEAAFARTLRPVISEQQNQVARGGQDVAPINTSTIRSIPVYSWKDWFFKVKSELKEGPNKTNLRNRKRIWKVAGELLMLVSTIKNPDRVLHGDLMTSPSSQAGRHGMSCLASEHDPEGCRELKQMRVSFGDDIAGSQFQALIPSFIIISDRRLISGLSFIFDDGRSVDAGYVVAGHKDFATRHHSESIWVICSPAGFETITLGEYPQEIVDRHSESRIAMARLPCQGLKGIVLGLNVGLSPLRVPTWMDMSDVIFLGHANCSDLL